MAATKGTLNSLTSNNPYLDGPGIIRISWTSSTGGEFDCEIASNFKSTFDGNNLQFGCDPVKVKGTIRKIVTDPGTAAPSANYDIVINDSDDLDVAGGNLANRAAATTEQYVPDPPVPVDTELTIQIDNAGSAKNGEIIIYMDHFA